jgi:N-acetylglucosamine-6-phosphate deacetylase
MDWRRSGAGGGAGDDPDVTLAPERSDGRAATRRVADAGAVGHTDATYERPGRRSTPGRPWGTHLFNAMRPVDHREPGAAIALLEDARVTVEMITDGVHLHPACTGR